MKGLGTNSIRPFVMTKNESLQTVWKSLFNRQKKDREKMNNLIKQVVERRVWEIENGMKKTDIQDLEALLRIGTRVDQMEDVGSHSSKSWVKLTPIKIKRAVGRRKYEMDQTTLMGLSAPTVRFIHLRTREYVDDGCL
jgi:hypothetical protein